MELRNPSGGGPHQDSLQFIFFNQRGFRPGWRLLTVVALYWVVSQVVGLLLSQLGPWLPQGVFPSALVLNETMSLSVVVFCTWVMSRIERRNMDEYGLPLRHSGAWPRFVRGYLLWGFLPLTVLLLVLRVLRFFYFGGLVLHDGQIFYWAAIWGLFFILVALTEEYMLRGYALYTLAEGIGFWPAAVVLAALFALLHMRNPGESRIGILMTAFFAMFACVTLRYTGTLWLAVGAHAGWDWAESYFYGVNNSGLQMRGHLLEPQVNGPAILTGGPAGPEGSILCLVLLVLMSVLFALLYRRAREPVLVVTKG